MKNVYLPITVDHIARVEGKGGVEIVVGDDGVKEVKLNIIEGPRFFEAITLGKKLDEALAIYPRICSFCSAAHKLTAVEAAEKAIGFTPREEIQALREVLYIGDMIESHALHLYLLVLPDYLGYSGPLHMIDEYKKEMSIALDLKNLGSWMMDELGSRAIHQENAVLGGFGKLPDKSVLENMKRRLKEALPKAEYTFELFTKLEQYEEVEGPITHIAVKPRNGVYGIYGDYLKASDGNEFPSEEYREHIKEFVVEHSFAKHSHYHGKPFMVGAISRLVNNADTLYGRAKELYESYKDLLRSTNPFANNLAQALELVYFTERAIDLIDEALAKWPIRPRDEVALKDGFGVSTTEAPRGVLVYALKVENGRVSYADIITPTAFNLAMMEQHVRMMAEKHYNDDPEKLKLLAEMVVRAYDPCISCSVHVARL
ncbi:cytosolic NiFe-hydrogenase, alpha subunit [Thermococcus kodakarensis KOD1]|uniref:Cytosolic NiFe-hydrogenase, alpha subunit n=1 Tax=Thermococcus kodakarensis (strain ATCC BAA-918 / JCM 12380 / KOD1) TaxID=69014 RepID=Q8NKS2_THEKO|nr:NADPH-dependent hydrogenase/sulfhydrogenase 1 subunit alpha [Thermococcus kodakarensis]5YXY_A Chain A, Cytosolic NiFe-hydrogenase, alpha subunit [Thermococcus kodakarensis KOD1]5YXY_B Chain B, Cytosolic NiFe-hydrogenase, alpha subunit [Thermococcus kodakarensis KOD1]5YXY_C Chain C, Cytosolic NiFe-hydrogenase, alpha subunit [Thermococcus kodakarensis KOD1]5YY0_A Chain A, Cytosolic NiFe-hydrogenase, alpha subunit [Thermococcus kodakarensis KOD1]WCN27929.1 NADPH-dependent hydrogenase/sulfhydro